MCFKLEVKFWYLKIEDLIFFLKQYNALKNSDEAGVFIFGFFLLSWVMLIVGFLVSHCDLKTNNLANSFFRIELIRSNWWYCCLVTPHRLSYSPAECRVLLMVTDTRWQRWARVNWLFSTLAAQLSTSLLCRHYKARNVMYNACYLLYVSTSRLSNSPSCE